MKRPPLGILLMGLGSVVGFLLAGPVAERYPDAFVGTSTVIIILVLPAMLVHVLRRRRQQRD
ncbi:hypothetical protein [Micromonospora sp. NPDC005324]|uniref:hypothetical protein n=1 Tax=Micromonospora sp. NPDC005324 TaxID=3157033 RepID=UPI0033A071DE